jgi:membrane-bound ClpP family serine protease
MPRVPLLAILLAASLGAGASGDVLVLSDGRILRGEVVDSSSREVSLRTRVDGAWTTLTFRRADVEKLYDEPGNQGDLPDRVEPVRETPRVPPDAARPAGGKVAVLPLHGQVGGLVDGSVHGTFDAALVEAALSEAIAAGAGVVILDIDSGGGFVTELEAICETIIAHHDALRIVAFTGDALSAAAVIALTCREIVVRPGARIGAAVLVDERDGEMTAVEAKRASPHHARQRQYMDAAGRPYALAAAMATQEAELWWSEEEGLAAAPGADAEGWEKVDGPTTVLTMTGRDAVRWGVATAMAAELDEALARLGASGEVIDLAPLVTGYEDDLQRRVSSLLDQVRDYFQSIGGLEAALSQAVRARDAGDGGTGAVTRAAELLESAEETRRRIERLDRPVAARRAELPPVFDERLLEDGARLGQVRRLIDGSAPGDLLAARDLVRSMLDGWKALLPTDR